MCTENKSNAIIKVFQKEVGLKLFQKQNFNLIAMNRGHNGPYKLDRKLVGTSVGVSFQHDNEASIEVYFKTKFYNDAKKANPTFDIFSQHFEGKDFKTKTKVDGEFHLFLMPIEQFDCLEHACRILNGICLDLNGSVRT